MLSKIELFLEVVVGFCDIFLVFKELFLERKFYSQENLVRDLFEFIYNVYNVLNDV